VVSAEERQAGGQESEKSRRKRKQQGRRPPDEILKKVIQEKAGIVSYVAEALKVTSRQVYRWRNKSKKVEQWFAETRIAVTDLAEATLLKNIKAGKTADTIFYLKCHGKARGYVERMEVSGPNGADLIPPEMAARRETERISELMKDPEYRELQSRMLMVLDRMKVKDAGNGHDKTMGGNGEDRSGGNGASESGGIGEVVN